MFGNLFKIFQRNTTPGDGAVSTLSNPSGWLLNMFGGHAKSGVEVSYNTAVGVSAVYAAVRILAESIAMLPLGLYERDGNGNVKEAFAHPVHRLLHDDPSDKYTSFVWRESTQYHLGLDGNGYSWIQYDNSGRPVELILLDPRTTDIVRDTQDRIFYYTSEYSRYLLPEEVLHIPALAYNGLKGLSPIRAHRETLGLSIAGTRFANVLYKNGAHVKGVLETDKRLSPDAAERLGNSFKNVYSSIDQAGGTPVLEEGVKYKQISLSPADAQYIENQRFQIEEIARIYRIPPHMLQALDRATFNNIEIMSYDFVKYTLLPWVKRYEGEMNRKLLRPDERKKYFVRFNLEGLMRGDTKSRAEYYRTLFYVGVLSPNDIRRLENMNTIQDGDRYYVQNNMISVEQLNQQSNNNNPS